MENTLRLHIEISESEQAAKIKALDKIIGKQNNMIKNLAVTSKDVAC